MRVLKIAGAAIAAVIVVAALLLIVGVPSGFLTSEIQARVERETGYRLTIAGSSKIGIWPSLNVTLNDVTLQDPKDRDGSSRLTVGSVQADVTLSSLWSGRPQVTELVINKPVLHVPLLRERSGQLISSARPAASPGGERQGRDRPHHGDRRRGGVFQPARPRGKSHRGHQRRGQHRRRPQGQDHRQREGRRSSAQIRHQRDRADAAAGAAEHSRRDHRSTRPAVAGAAVGQGRGPAQRFDRDDQRPVGRARRRRVQRLGLGRSRQQAAGQTRSRLPAARPRRRHAARRIGRAALEQCDLRPQRLELCRRAGAGFRRRAHRRRRAIRAGRDRRHARQRRAQGAVFQSRRLWRPGQRRSHRRCFRGRAQFRAAQRPLAASARCRF